MFIENPIHVRVPPENISQKTIHKLDLEDARGFLEDARGYLEDALKRAVLTIYCLKLMHFE